MDLEKFFGRVNHDVLMARISRRIEDKRVILLIRRCLQAGMMAGGIVTAREGAERRAVIALVVEYFAHRS